METQPKQTGIKAKINENFITSKLLMIGFLTLVLLIPKFMVDDLIRERKNRLSEAEKEIWGQWSRDQTLIGPYISIPYLAKTTTMQDGKEVESVIERLAYFFPEDLNIDTKLEGFPLKRGIFEIVVYKSALSISGHFKEIDLSKTEIRRNMMDFSRAKIHIGINDMRGMETIPTVFINGANYITEQFSDPINKISGIAAEIDLTNWNSDCEFSIKMNLNGSRKIYFTPVGKSTKIKMDGDWKDPSFSGNFLPSYRNVTNAGFDAEWSVNHFNRDFGQEFFGKLPNLSDNAFGVSLKLPVDQYQKTTRASKYAIIVIVLGFLSILLLELITKTKIHFFQYTLVGLALILFYSILLAISEHIGFNLAYIIAAISTITLLGLYSLTFSKRSFHSTIFAIILTVFYSFIFVLVVEQEYSLLLGSLGLFAALAVTMYSSRKINWYSNGKQYDMEKLE
jgi:inner membrane protein